LDIACGAGRHCHAFGSLGYRVVGVDQSLPALQAAKEEAEKASTGAVFLQGDMRSLPLADGAFDCAFNIYTSWAVFDADRDNLAVLSEAYRCLRQGGTFILEYTNKWASDNPRVTRDPKDMGTYSYDRTADFDKGTGMYSGFEIYEPKQGGEERRDYWQVTVYRPEQLLHMLREAGFTAVQMYGDWHRSPLQDDSKRIVAVATKTRVGVGNGDGG